MGQAVACLRLGIVTVDGWRRIGDQDRREAPRFPRQGLQFRGFKGLGIRVQSIRFMFLGCRILELRGFWV